MTIPKFKYEELGGQASRTAALPDIALWGERGEERLVHTDLGAAIEAYIDDCDLAALLDKNEPLLFVGFVRMKPDPNVVSADWLIEFAVERLDEEFGDPEGNYSWKVTEAVKTAAQAFVDVLYKDYNPWSCEDGVHVEVDIRAWCEKNAPEWLKEAEAAK